MAAAAGISLATQPAAFARQRDARLPDNCQADRELGARCFGLGMERQLVVARLGLPRDRQRGLHILRLAGFDGDRGDLLAAIGFGKAHLEILWRVGAEIDRRVAAAVVGDADPVFERGRRGAAQGREIRRQLQFRGQLLADGQRDRQFLVALSALRLHREAVIALAGVRRRLQPQLQPLLAVGRDFDCRDGLAAAEDRRLPAIGNFRHRDRQRLRRQFEIAHGEVDRRGLAGAHGQRRIPRRQEQASDIARAWRLIGGEGAPGPQHHHKNSKEPPHHAENPPGCCRQIHHGARRTCSARQDRDDGECRSASLIEHPPGKLKLFFCNVMAQKLLTSCPNQPCRASAGAPLPVISP